MRLSAAISAQTDLSVSSRWGRSCTTRTFGSNWTPRLCATKSVGHGSADMETIPTRIVATASHGPLHASSKPGLRCDRPRARNKDGENPMAGEESVVILRPVASLPIALYDSNGLLFELYEGGQPYRRHHIVWERLKPITEEESPSVSVAPDRD